MERLNIFLISAGMPKQRLVWIQELAGIQGIDPQRDIVVGSNLSRTLRGDKKHAAKGGPVRVL